MNNNEDTSSELLTAVTVLAPDAGTVWPNWETSALVHREDFSILVTSSAWQAHAYDVQVYAGDAYSTGEREAALVAGAVCLADALQVVADHLAYGYMMCPWSDCDGGCQACGWTGIRACTVDCDCALCMDELMAQETDRQTGQRQFTQYDYNREVMRSIVEAVAEWPERYAEVRSLADLHDRCDANVFTLEAEARFADTPSGMDNDWQHVNVAYKFVADVFRWSDD